MPIIKSAKKRVKVARKATVRNSKTKRSLKGALKSFTSALSSGKGVNEAQRKAQSNLDKAVKKGVISKNKAARKKKQLSTKAKAAGTKSTAKKVATKKPTAKKPLQKKTAAKKPVAKKSTTKK
ncbi:30S ribosomal protein S20 [Candidatus Saccharibacteria bacterium]|nr:30S ribosomal protein S20 [Candidatus Saccharibacteria bacterium]